MNAGTTVHGSATPGAERIKRSLPDIRQDDIDAVSAALASGAHVSGDATRQLEQQLCDLTNAPYARTVSSGTNALVLALHGLGVSTGDEVVLPSFVCYSVLSAVEQVGATPVLADIDGNIDRCGHNISASSVETLLTAKTRAIIVPHMLGMPADIEAFLSLGPAVVEDCAQSLGASRDGTRVGSQGHVSTYSFFATKVISTGQGGAIVTASPEVNDRISDRMLVDKRERRGAVLSASLTNFQAALGASQMRRLDNSILRRVEIGAQYEAAFAEISVELPPSLPGSFPFKYVLMLDDEQQRDALHQHLGQLNIGVDQPVFRPLHRYLDLPAENFTNSEASFARALALPSYSALTDAQVERVATAVCDFLNG